MKEACEKLMLTNDDEDSLFLIHLKRPRDKLFQSTWSLKMSILGAVTGEVEKMVLPSIS